MSWSEAQSGNTAAAPGFETLHLVIDIVIGDGLADLRNGRQTWFQTAAGSGLPPIGPSRRGGITRTDHTPRPLHVATSWANDAVLDSKGDSLHPRDEETVEVRARPRTHRLTHSSSRPARGRLHRVALRRQRHRVPGGFLDLDDRGIDGCPGPGWGGARVGAAASGDSNDRCCGHANLDDPDNHDRNPGIDPAGTTREQDTKVPVGR